jgi:GNAT superfamily N-acetyltransferase
VTSEDTRAAVTWHTGSRDELRPLFELADDSSAQTDSYIHLGDVLVARDTDGAIVGHLQLLWTTDGAAEVKSIAVRDDHQRRGIGRQLIAQALAVCRDKGIQTITVTTATADIDNLRFYQGCGFRATSIQHDAFTEADGYPPGLEANGIPVRDSLTFTRVLHPRAG